VPLSDLSSLSSLLWELVHHHPIPDSDYYEYLISIENLRTQLLILSPDLVSQLDEADEMGFSQWCLIAGEMLRDIQEMLKDSQQKRDVNTYESDFCGLLDDRFRRLDVHTVVLSSAIKAVQSKSLEPISKIFNVTTILPTESGGSELWVSSFGKQTYRVKFEQFQRCLSARFPELTQRAMIQLRSSIDPKETGFVTALQWTAFLEGFGPDISRAVERLSETLGEDFFAGYLTYEEAAEALRMCSTGAYLIRFSTSMPCGLVLARRVSSDEVGGDKVVQSLIVPRKGGYEMEGTIYSSLRDVLSFKAKECRFPAPVVSAVMRAKFFKGFLSKEETLRLLQDAPSGTFLFRFSNSDPGALVVGYKVGKEVKQTRIYCEPESGGYRLAGADASIYPHIDDIVRQNGSRLKFPYGATDDGASIVSGNHAIFSRVNDRYGGLSAKEDGRGTVYGVIDPLL
jgi:Fe-S-cluster formation regulator IscX/YfhJ